MNLQTKQMQQLQIDKILNKYSKYKYKYTKLKKSIKKYNSYGGSNGIEIIDINTNQTNHNTTNYDRTDAEIKSFELNQIENVKRKLQNFCLDSNINYPYSNIESNLWIWSNIKTKYKNNTITMQKFFNLRQTIVDDLISNIFDFFGCEDTTCSKQASGSTGADANLFSDYDLTIVHQNLLTSKIIRSFNTIIEGSFGFTPAEALDTNLYGYSPIMPKTNNFNNTRTWYAVPFDPNKYFLQQTEKDKLQDEWALKRLATHIHTSNIKIRSNEILTWLSDNTNNINHMDSKEKNDKYVEHMQYFEDLLKEYNDDNISNNNDTLMGTSEEQIQIYRNNMINALSFMNFYGDETYFTIGSFLHVVGTMFYFRNKSTQEKMSLITSQQLIHSMIENLSYFIHAMDRTHNDVLIALKYMDRFFDAYNLFIKKNNLILSDNKKQTLNLIIDLLKTLKSKYRNRSDQEIIDYENSNNNLFTIADVSRLKKERTNLLNKLLLNYCNNSANINCLFQKDDLYEFYINCLVLIIKKCSNNLNTFITIDNENPYCVEFMLND